MVSIPKSSKSTKKDPKSFKIWLLGCFPGYGKSTYFYTGFYGPLRAKYALCTGGFFGHVPGTYPVRISTYPVLVRTRYVPKKSYHNPCKIDLGGGKTLPKLVGVEVFLNFFGFLDGNHDKNNVDIASNNIFDWNQHQKT